MNLVLQRGLRDGHTLQGSLLLDGTQFCATIENEDLAIPVGQYSVTVCWSDEASTRRLWTPDPRDYLPLLWNVHGRSGIRIHAANTYRDLKGCIGVGQAGPDATLNNSRFWLTLLMYRMAILPTPTPIILAVFDPSTGQQNA